MDVPTAATMAGGVAIKMVWAQATVSFQPFKGHASFKEKVWDFS